MQTVALYNSLNANCCTVKVHLPNYWCVPLSPSSSTTSMHFQRKSQSLKKLELNSNGTLVARELRSNGALVVSGVVNS